MKQRKCYTREFEAQAVELLATGKPVPERAEELCVSSNLLYNGRDCARLQVENDILKKPRSSSGSESRPAPSNDP